MQPTTIFTGTWQSDHASGISGHAQLELPTSSGDFISELIFTAATGRKEHFELQGKYDKNLGKYWLMPRDLVDVEGSFLISLSFYEHSKMWQGFYSRFGDLGRLALESPVKCAAVQVTCDGCLNNYANQLGHMDPGGCLYQDD